MVSEQPTRQMVKELKRAGWEAIRTDGRHTVYGCSCGKHTFALPASHRTI
jgi:predicted RNA binding protein YcfA (HicA-like mRNA interferase family)